MSCLTESNCAAASPGASLEADPQLARELATPELEPSAQDEAREAAHELHAAQARLATALHKVKVQGLWKAKHASFSAYLTNELHLKPSAANELTRVAQTLTAAGVPLAEAEAVGFHKLSIVQRAVRIENRDEVLRDVRELDAAELQQRYRPRPSPSPRTVPPLAVTPLAIPSGKASAGRSGAGVPEGSRESVEGKGAWGMLVDAIVDHPRGGVVSGLMAFALLRSEKFTNSPEVAVNLEFILREFLQTHPDPQSPPTASALTSASTSSPGANPTDGSASPPAASESPRPSFSSTPPSGSAILRHRNHLQRDIPAPPN